MGSAGRIVFVGAATIDSIALVPHYPGADERVVVDDLVRAGGGPAATAAVAAARAGCEVSLVAAIGDDSEGDEILTGLQDENIDLSGIVRVPGARSASSLVTVASDHSTRALCSRPGPELTGAVEQALITALDGASWAHTDHHGWPLIARLWPTLPEHPKLSIDDGHFLGKRELSLIDLYAPTLPVLRWRSGRDDIDDAMNWALAGGAEAVVATDGASGSYGLRVDDQLFHQPSADIEVISTLGAGDVFHGALVAAVSRGHDLRSAVQCATRTAAQSCRALDGRGAIPDRRNTAAQPALGSADRRNSPTGSRGDQIRPDRTEQS